MRRPALLALVVVVSTVLLARSAGARPAAAFCNSLQLTGSFTVVPGSAGAGNIVYALVLRNHSPRSCTVTGLPRVTLLGLHGKTLPTHVRAASPNQLTAVLVRLPPGASARATARFSPDVPGPGEQQRGACESKAYALAVNVPGGGVTRVPVQPPTPVCEHGQLQFKAYTRAP
jgi:Protein of unknown function (DUF4232)